MEIECYFSMMRRFWIVTQNTRCHKVRAPFWSFRQLWSHGRGIWDGGMCSGVFLIRGGMFAHCYGCQKFFFRELLMSTVVKKSWCMLAPLRDATPRRSHSYIVEPVTHKSWHVVATSRFPLPLCTTHFTMLFLRWPRQNLDAALSIV